MGSILCPECGFAYPDHKRTCTVAKIAKEKEQSKAKQLHELMELDELVKNNRPRPSIKLRVDGDTWMVSVIHPDNDDEGGDFGSAWYSERAGKTPLEAAKSYYNDDPMDNPGVRLCHKEPDLVIICVIGQQIAPSGKPWRISLFSIRDGEVVPFP